MRHQRVEERRRGESKERYLRFKKEILVLLATHDGLGLLESGVFEKYERMVWGRAIQGEREGEGEDRCMLWGGGGRK